MNAFATSQTGSYGDGRSVMWVASDGDGTWLPSLGTCSANHTTQPHNHTTTQPHNHTTTQEKRRQHLKL